MGLRHRLGVLFVEALKAAGKTFTRASFLKTLTHTTFSQTPSLNRFGTRALTTRA